MNKHIIYLTVFILALSSANIKAQQQLSLQDAIITGLSNNFDIQVGEMNAEIAGIQNTWGNAGMWPSINLQLGMNNALDDRFDNTNTSVNFNGRITANWILFDGFAVQIRKSRLDYLERISGGNAAVIVENTIQAIILGYNMSLLEKERLTVLESVMQLSRDRFDYIQHKQELGVAGTYDVSQAKADWLTDKTNYLTQKMNVRTAMRQLSYLMAMPVETEFELNGQLQPSVNDYQLAALKDKMIAENRTLKNQYLNLTVSEYAIKLEKSARYPSIALNAGASSTYYPEDLNTNENIQTFGGSYSLYANLALSYNIFDGNRVNRNIEIAQIQKQIAQVQVDEMNLRLNNQLFDFFDLYDVRKELYLLQQENLETAKLNLEISTERFRNGAISSFDFRNAQRTYLETALRQIQSIYNLIDTDTNIIRITGGIIAEFGE